MKLDLGELERKARQDSDHNTMSEVDPDEMLALIARNRELEATIIDLLDHAVIVQDGAAAERARSILDKGAVLP